MPGQELSLVMDGAMKLATVQAQEGPVAAAVWLTRGHCQEGAEEDLPFGLGHVREFLPQAATGP